MMLLNFFSITFLATLGAWEGSQPEVAHEISGSDTPRVVDQEGAGYLFKNYFYANPADLNDRLIVVRTTKDWRIRYLNDVNVEDVIADGKEADEVDRSVKLYVPTTPIRFYLPASSRDALVSREWRYRACRYKKLQESYSLTDDMRKIWTILIESRCDDASVARYYYDDAFGLVAITIAAETDDEKVFHQDKTYFLDPDHAGFGVTNLQTQN